MTLTERPRILLVEKDRETARVLKTNLERSGFSVDMVHTGKEGVDRAETGAYHLFCIDHTLSDTTGSEVLRVISSRDERPPTIMLIADHSEDIPIEDVSPKIDEYIVKDDGGMFCTLVPFVVKQLLAYRALRQEKEKIEEDLQDQRILMQAFVDTVPNPAFYKGADGRYLGCNRFFEEYIGVERNKIIGQTIYDILPRDVAFPFAEMDRRLLNEPDLQTCECLLPHADGSHRDALMNKQTYIDSDGSIAGVIGIVNDISARKRAEQLLEQERRIYELIAQSSLTSETIGELSRSILGGLLNILDFDFGSIHLLDESGTLLQPVSVIVRGYGDEDLVHALRPVPIDDIDHICSLVVQTGGSIIVPDVIGHPLYSTHGSQIDRFHIKSLISHLFLSHEHRPLGVLQMFSRRTRSMTSDEESSFRRFAELVGLALLRQEMREKLKQTETQFRLITENMKDNIWLMDEHFLPTFFSPSMFRDSGFSMEELREVPFEQCITPAFQPTVKRILEYLPTMQRRENQDDVLFVTEDLEFQRKDGSTVLQEVKFTPVWDNHGKPISYLCVSRDITARRRAEEALRESRENLQAFFDATNDLAMLCDVNGDIVLANRAAEQSFNDSDLAGKNVFMLMSDEMEKRYQEHKQSIFQQKRRAQWEELERGRWYHIIIHPVLDDKDRVARLAVFCRDITERRENEKRIQAIQRMEAIGTLTDGIAHDFNNILAAIMGYSSYLKTKAHPDDEFHEGLNVIEESSIRAAKLSKQLLAISRRGTGEISPIDVNRIVMEVHALISKTFEKSISIDLETSKSLPNIKGDESQIHQVVMNLAINARNAMPGSGRLSIRTYLEKVSEKRKKTDYSINPGTYVCIEITDDGCGMDNDTLQHIFEPYFTTRRDQGGSGLGMSVVYGIVKRHEGYIDIFSTPGEGTRVVVYFPSTRAREMKTVDVPASASKNTETILIIDDEKNIVQLLNTMLTENGYTVHSATSIRGGIELFEEHSDVVDLVILDMMMPGMKGAEALEELKRIDPDVNVLLTSGHSEVDQYGELLEKGAAAFIAKPFNVSELLRTIRKLLD